MSVTQTQTETPVAPARNLMWPALIIGGFLFLSVCAVITAFALGAFRQAPAGAGADKEKEKEKEKDPQKPALTLNDISIVGQWSSGYEFQRDTVSWSYFEGGIQKHFTGHWCVEGKDVLVIQPPQSIQTPVIIDGVNHAPPPPPWKFKVEVLDRNKLRLTVVGSDQQPGIWERR